MKSPMGRAVDIILVLCAISTTVAMFMRTESAPANPDNARRSFDGWKKDLAFDRRIGSEASPFKLVVWTDYQCPACKQLEGELERTKAQLKDSMSIVYRHYPLPMHPLAFKAAVAAECARGQGRFEAMHKTLFARNLTGDSLPMAALIADAGITNIPAFNACLSDSTASVAVRADMERGRALQLRGTPDVQIGDKIGLGGMSAEEMIPLMRKAR